MDISGLCPVKGHSPETYWFVGNGGAEPPPHISSAARLKNGERIRV